jgi:hypothetical protein
MNFKLEVVGIKKFATHEMPSADEVLEKLKRLWDICWKPDEDLAWDPQRDLVWKPLSKFIFRKREDSEPVFRVKDFEQGREDGIGGLDLLGTYRRHDSLVTIYIDSCFKAARKYNVLLGDLIDVVLIHELAHLVTHHGFVTSNLSSHFMEFTGQCLTYAYLKSNADHYAGFGYLESNADSYARWGHLKAKDDRILKVFEVLSKRQPFDYRTWECLKELPKCKWVILSRPPEVEAVVKAIFQAVLHTLRTPSRDESDGVLNY